MEVNMTFELRNIIDSPVWSKWKDVDCGSFYSDDK